MTNKCQVRLFCNLQIWLYFIELFPKAILKQTNAFGPYDIPTVIAKLQNYHISIGVKKLLDLLDMIKQVTIKKRLERFLVKINNLQYEQAYF